MKTLFILGKHEALFILSRAIRKPDTGFPDLVRHIHKFSLIKKLRNCTSYMHAAKQLLQITEKKNKKKQQKKQKNNNNKKKQQHKNTKHTQKTQKTNKQKTTT